MLNVALALMERLRWAKAVEAGGAVVDAPLLAVPLAANPTSSTQAIQDVEMRAVPAKVVGSGEVAIIKTNPLETTRSAV